MNFYVLLFFVEGSILFKLGVLPSFTSRRKKFAASGYFIAGDPSLLRSLLAAKNRMSIFRTKKRTLPYKGRVFLECELVLIVNKRAIFAFLNASHHKKIMKGTRKSTQISMDNNI